MRWLTVEARVPFGGGFGFTAMPYAQVAYNSGRGALLGGGLMLAMTFERWRD
jgi:hypothetical protein